MEASAAIGDAAFDVTPIEKLVLELEWFDNQHVTNVKFNDMFYPFECDWKIQKTQKTNVIKSVNFCYSSDF